MTELREKSAYMEVPVEQFVPVEYDDYAVMSSWVMEKYWKPVSGD